MNTIQAAFSSARFTRLMFWFGGAVLAAGVLLLASTVVGGTDKTTFGPEPGFQATLPEHTKQLRTADGKAITSFSQLDPEMRSTIRTFLATAVARKHLERSWDVIAPSVKRGYTYAKWKNAHALPVVPYPIDNVNRVSYYLDYASTEEILIEVGLASKAVLKIRPASFQLGLVPVRKGAQTRWLVDYWMPRWTPLLPVYE
jgi:hypothetical protein